MSIEMAIMMGTVFISFLFLSVYAGRVVRQEADVRSAAHAAARTGSLYSWSNASVAAVDAASENMATSGTACQGGPVVAVRSTKAQFEQKTTGTGVAPGFFSIQVDCTISTVPLFGTSSYSYTAVEVVDTFREED